MKEELLKIINNYGVMPQLKYFQSEVFELNEAIISYEVVQNKALAEIDCYPEWHEKYKEHIAEEISDCLVMLKQFQYYYGIEDKEIAEIMKYKVERQLERINRGE